MMPHSSFQLSFYLSVELQYKSRPFGIAAVQREAAIHFGGNERTDRQA